MVHPSSPWNMEGYIFINYVFSFFLGYIVLFPATSLDTLYRGPLSGIWRVGFTGWRIRSSVDSTQSMISVYCSRAVLNGRGFHFPIIGASSPVVVLKSDGVQNVKKENIENMFGMCQNTLSINTCSYYNRLLLHCCTHHPPPYQTESVEAHHPPPWRTDRSASSGGHVACGAGFGAKDLEGAEAVSGTRVNRVKLSFREDGFEWKCPGFSNLADVFTFLPHLMHAACCCRSNSSWLRCHRV